MLRTLRLLRPASLLALSWMSHSAVMMSPEPSVSALIRGGYENRIRRYSPPQKIFTVFASQKEHNGVVTMSIDDLLNAICFYNFSSVQELEGDQTTNLLQQKSQANRSLALKICRFLGKEDMFQLQDYYMLIRFLGYSHTKLQGYFKSKSANSEASKQSENRYISLDAEEMTAFFTNQIYKDHAKTVKGALIFQSRGIGATQGGFEGVVSRSVSSLMKGARRVTLQQLTKLREEMLRDVYEFEFGQFRKGSDNCIDGTDFARSMVKYMHQGTVKKFMKRIRSIEGSLEQVKIGKDAYVGLHTCVQNNLPTIEREINAKGAFSAEALCSVVNRHLQTYEQLSVEQIGVLISLLDMDESGFVEKKELLGVLSQLEYYSSTQPVQRTFREEVEFNFSALRSKVERIVDIINE